MKPDIKSKRYGAAVDIDALALVIYQLWDHPEGPKCILVELASIMNDQRKYVESLEARVRDLEREKRHTGVGK